MFSHVILKELKKGGVSDDDMLATRPEGGGQARRQI
jgi:hypothetical protein